MKATAGLLTLALSTQIAFPAFASEAQKQQLALATMTAESKQEIINAASRLEKHLSGLNDTDQRVFYTRILKLMDRAESKMARMTDTQLEHRLQKASKTKAAPAHIEMIPTGENQEAASVADAFNQSAKLPASPDSMNIDQVDQVLASVNGTSARSNITILIQNLRQSLAQKVADHPTQNRVVAEIFSYLILGLIVLIPLLLCIAVGVLLSAILLPLIVGLAITAVWIFLLVRFAAGLVPN